MKSTTMIPPMSLSLSWRASSSVFRFRTVSTVHVNHVHCLCVLDYHVGTMAVVDRFAETRLNLFGYVEVVENWNFTRIEFYDVRFFRGYKRHVVFYFLINIFVVDVDVLITWVVSFAPLLWRPPSAW